jgi:hypothetical protein
VSWRASSGGERGGETARDGRGGELAQSLEGAEYGRRQPPANRGGATRGARASERRKTTRARRPGRAGRVVTGRGGGPVGEGGVRGGARAGEGNGLRAGIWRGAAREQKKCLNFFREVI